MSKCLLLTANMIAEDKAAEKHGLPLTHGVTPICAGTPSFMPVISCDKGYR